MRINRHYASARIIGTMAAALVTATVSADSVLSDGDFNSLAIGNAPSVGSAAGRWYFPANYVAAGAAETNITEFTTVQAPSGPAGDHCLQLSADSSLAGNQLLPNFLNRVVTELLGRIVVVAFDIYVYPGHGGGAAIVGYGDYNTRGPQLIWTQTGNITYVTGPVVAIQTVVSNYPAGVWQSVRLEIDLSADTYDMYWGLRGTALEKVGTGLGFRSGALPAVDCFTVARFVSSPDSADALSCFDNVSVTVLEPPAWALAGGRVRAWGWNSSGQTNVPPTLENVIGIAAGYAHTVAVKADGTVVAWGSSSYGGTSVPAGLSNVISVAAGGYRSLALKRDGTVVAWGSVPGSGPPQGLSNVVAIAAGDSLGLALKNDGSVVGWGYTSVPGGLKNVVAIAAGSGHGLALKAGGALVLWGNNGYGQCTLPPRFGGATGMGAGYDHTLALQGSSVAGWGRNDYGQSTPPDAAWGAKEVTGGEWHSLALVGQTVRAWGRNNYGQTNVPAGLANVVAIAAGSSHNVALVVTGGPPFFISQPVGQVLIAGDTSKLRAIAAGNYPYYQWLLNGTNVPGANGDTLELSNVQPNQAGVYSVVAANGLGSVTSLEAPVVVAPLLITSQPQSQTPFLGGSMTLSVSAQSALAVSYQWQLAGTNVDGATNSSLTLAGMEWGQSGDYRVVLSNSYGVVTSAVANVSVVQVAAWGDNGSGQTTVPADLTNVIAVAGGGSHSLALKGDGTVAAWGANSSGQTTVPEGLTNVAAVAAGHSHSVALKGDGTVAAWGDGYNGQTAVPAGLTNVVAITAGGYQNLALKWDRSVVAWGAFWNGSEYAPVPSAVSNVVAVAAGYDHCLALRGDGTVVAWGDGSLGQTNLPADLTNVVAIAAGYYHNLALRTDGTVAAWGYNSNGQTNVPADLTNVVAIAAGSSFSLALQADGTVVKWGSLASVPTGLTNGVAVAGGWSHALALVGDGSPMLSAPLMPLLAVRGMSARLQVGAAGTAPLRYQWSFNGTNLPGATNATLVLSNVQPGQGGVYSVTVSNAFGVVISSNQVAIVPIWIEDQVQSQKVLLGATAGFEARVQSGLPVAYQWRLNGVDLPGATTSALNFANAQFSDAGAYSIIASNAFGSASREMGRLSVVQVAAWGYNYNGQTTVPDDATDLVAIAAGERHNLALKAGGSVTTWGYGGSGLTNIPSSLTNAVAIGAGSEYSLALRSDGTLAAWGENSYGQTNVPAELTNVALIAAGDRHSLAMSADGLLTGWGYNGYGQTTIPESATNAVALAAGDNHSLALRSDGTVVAWGRNYEGQTTVPDGLTNVIAIAAGGDSSFALKGDGTVVAWGEHDNGQTNVPPEFTNLVGIAAGYYHALGVRADGGVVAWGGNWSGQTEVPTWLPRVMAAAGGGQHSLALIAHGPPSLTAPLLDRTVAAGTSAEIRVWASGPGPLAYQWRCDGTNLPGATTAALSLANVQLNAAGVYSVLVSNSYGVTASRDVVLTVVPLFARVEPMDQSAFLWGDALFSASVEGMGPWNFQWQFNGADIPGATDSTLALARVRESDAGAYRVVVNNPVGVGHSPGARLSVLRVTGWGANDYSQITLPTTLTNVMAIAAGDRHSLALNGDGTVVGWGEYYNRTTYQSVPVTIPPDAVNVIAVAAGGNHSLALRGDGTVVAWGTYWNGTTNFPMTAPSDLRDVVAIAAGENHALALKADGRVVGWGNNVDWQCSPPLGLSDVVAIAANGNHSLAVRSDGTVVAWPQADVPAGLSNVVSIAAGYGHSLALKADGSVTTWGSTGGGLTNIPAGLTNAVAVAAGSGYSVALRSDGTVVGWGGNWYGQTNVPLALTNVSAVAAGQSHALALIGDGPPVPLTPLCLPPPAALIGWWPGDGSANDVSGANHGSLQGGATFAPGLAGQAFSLNGLSDSVLVPDHPSLNPGSQVTLEAWVFPTAESGAPDVVSMIMNKEGAAGMQFGIGRRNTQSCSAGTGVAPGNLVFSLGGITGLPNDCENWVDGMAALPVNTWNHVALTFDGAAVRVYKNGVATRQVPATGTLVVGPGPLVLGGRSSPATQAYWAGYIDEAGVYGRALSSAEIGAIHAAGTAGKCNTNQPTEFARVVVRANPVFAGQVSGGGFFRLGTTVSVRAMAATNLAPYVFVKWTEGGLSQGANNPYIFTLTGDRQLVANFDLPSYRVSVTNNPPGAGFITGTGSFKYGSAIILNAVPIYGYRFASWTENGVTIGTSATLTTVVYSNRAFAANYVGTNLSHMVTVASQPSGLTYIPGSGTYSNGASVVFSAPPSVISDPYKYWFKRWTLNGVACGTNESLTKVFSTTDPTNLSFVAEYEAKSLRPVVLQAVGNLPAPGPATTNFVVTLRFDRSMQKAVEPLLVLINPATLGQANVPTGGVWVTTWLTNDTYRTPPITFTQDMDGVNLLYASQATDLNGWQLTLTNCLSVVVDATPPVFFGVSVSAGPQWAAVTWITDEPATAQVEYGTNAGYGSSSPLDSSYLTSRTVGLSNLLPNTTYHFRLRSRDRAGNEGVSGDEEFTTARAADLEAAGIVVSPVTNLVSGLPLSVTWVDANHGEGPATGSWHDQVVVSNATAGQRLWLTNVTYDAAQFGAVTNGGSVTRECGLRLPDGPSGAGLLVFTVTCDISNSVAEYNAGGTAESNNSASVTRSSDLAAYPDLAVIGLTVPASGLPGQPAQITWGVTNRGTAAPAAPWVDSISLSADAVIGGDQLLTSFTQTNLLAPGGSIMRTQMVILPSAIVGSRFVVVSADSASQVFEVNKTNNTAISTAAIQLLNPDLVVSSVAGPASAQFGASILVAWTASNAGTAAAPGNWVDQAYLSSSPNSISGATVLLSQAINNAVALATNSSYTRTQMVTLPVGPAYSAGTYYVLVQSDAENALFESNETNNVAGSAALSVAQPPLPDLAVSAILAPASGLASQPLALIWTVTNRGAASAAGPWTDGVLLAPGSSGSNAQALASVTYSNLLAPGGWVAITNTVTLPNNLFGARYFVVQADSGGQVFEGTAETNNQTVAGSATMIGGPDLTIGSLAVSPDTGLQSGDEVTLTWLDSNAGAGPTAGSWHDQVVVTNSNLGQRVAAATVYYNAALRGSIAGGGARSNSCTVRLPDGVSGTGVLQFTVTADGSGALAEHNAGGTAEANNSASIIRNSILKEYPDLVATEISGPATGLPGQPLPITWSIMNQGPVDAAGVRSDVVSLSTDAFPGSDQVLQSFGLGRSIPAGESIVETQMVILPGGLVGQRYFVVTVNAGNQVFELATTNNTVAADRPITPLNPDLVVAWVGAPAGAQLGQTITVQWAVQNAGTATNTVQWNDQVYLSTSSNSVAGANVLASVPAPRLLAPGGSYTNSVTVSLPLSASRPPGSYFLVVVADASGVQPEADEGNNLGYGLVTLSYPALPDLTVSGVSAPASAVPGQNIPVSWTVVNPGAAAASGAWVETVYLSTDGTLSTARLLGSFPCAVPITAGGLTGRVQMVTVPATGPAGNVFMLVSVDSGNTLLEENEANNTGVSASTMRVPASLTLNVPVAQIAENAANPNLGVSVSRNGPVADPISVLVTSSDAGKLSAPAIVTIAAGQGTAGFNLTVHPNGIVDPDELVSIAVTAPGFVGSTGTVSVLNTDQPRLAMTVAQPVIAEGFSTTVTLSRDLVTTQALAVTISSSSPRHLGVPGYAVIPASAATCTFAVLGLDDQLVTAPLTHTITATAGGHVTATAEVTIADVSIPAITLELASTNISEGAGPNATTGTIHRHANAGQLYVAVRSSETTNVLVPPLVGLASGQFEVSFPIGAVDNQDVDGPRTNLISAFVVDSYSGQQVGPPEYQTLVVSDNDGPTLTLNVARKVVPEGGSPATTATVRCKPSTNIALVVSLSSSDTNEATVPGSVTIPAGQGDASFDIRTIDDGVTDGSKRATITASASSYVDGVDFLLVSDVNLADLVISSVSAPRWVDAEAAYSLSYRVVNQGLAAAGSSFVTRAYLCTDSVGHNPVLIDAWTNAAALPAGQYFDRTVELTAPLAVKEYWVLVEADVRNEVAEILENNNLRVSAAPIEVEAAYYATVEVDTPITNSGGAIVLRGEGWWTGSDDPAAGVVVNLHVLLGSSDRIITARTDTNGNFVATFTPLPGEAGAYTIVATHPGESSLADNLSGNTAYLTLRGMKLEAPNAYQMLTEREPWQGRFTLRNLGNAALTLLHAEVIQKPDNLAVTSIYFEGGDALPANGVNTLNLQLFADNSTNTLGEAIVRVTCKEGVVAEGKLYLSITRQRAHLVARNATLNGSMVRGRSRTVEFQMGNDGAAPTGPITLLLPSAPWLASPVGQVLPSIAPWESLTVSLSLSPGAHVPLTVHSGSIVLQCDTASLSLPFSFRCVSDVAGGLAVSAVDEFYYYGAGSPKLTNALVRVLDAFNSTEVIRGNTGTNGTVTFTNLIEGPYTVEVSADKHLSYRSTVQVEGGETNQCLAFLSRQVVTYVWTVEPVEIEERVLISVQAVFETVVPKPVIVVSPTLIDLSSLTVPGQTMQVDLHITNHGLIAWQGVKVGFETNDLYELKPLIEDLGTLAARSDTTVPVMARYKGTTPMAKVKGASAAASGGACSMFGSVSGYNPCGPNKVSEATSVQVVWGGCDPSPSGHPAILGGGWGAPSPPIPGWSGGSSGPGVSYCPIVVSDPQDCPCPPKDPPCDPAPTPTPCVDYIPLPKANECDCQQWQAVPKDCYAVFTPCKVGQCINGIPQEVPVQLSFSSYAITVYAGGSKTVNASITPDCAMDKVSFQSSDTSVATVSVLTDPGAGKVLTIKGVKAGPATINAKVNGGICASASVTVAEGIHLYQDNHPDGDNPHEIKKDGTAWITASPQMPYLRARVPGASGNVTWTLDIEYSGFDYGSESHTLPADTDWRIYDTESWLSQFMGGKATLKAVLADGTCQLDFKILGRNPDDDTVKDHVNEFSSSRGEALRPYFLAMLKLETASPGETPATATWIYNHFLPASGSKGDKGSPVCTKSAGGAAWGIAQIYSKSGSSTVTRNMVWSWQENLRYAFASILLQKEAYANRYWSDISSYYGATPGPYPSPTASPRVSGWEAMVITGYNGFGGTCNNPGIVLRTDGSNGCEGSIYWEKFGDHNSSYTCWEYGEDGSWDFLRNSEHYVDRVLPWIGDTGTYND